MAIEAPVSKFKKGNLKLYMIACLLAAIIFGYDGYLSKYEWSKRHKFYQKHFIDNGGKPDSTMSFNQKSTPVLILGAVLLGIYLIVIGKKKLITDDNELIIDDKEKISLDSIQKIDKTDYEKKGSFVITYKDSDGREINRKLSNRAYDNMAAVLDHLVAKIS